MDIKDLWLEGIVYIQLAQDKNKSWIVMAMAVNQPLGSIKGENFFAVEWLSASYEGLCFMVLVIFSASNKEELP